MTIIYLVRHGQTDFIGKKLCGTLPGVHLNEEGRSQAQSTAEYLSQFPIKAIFSSPMERTLETAAYLADHHSVSVTPKEFLKEVNFGELQGKLQSDLATDPFWQQFQNDPAELSFPGGENIRAVQARAVAGLEEVLRGFGPTDQIVCVSHSELLRLTVAHAIGVPLEHSHRLTIEPASVTKLEWTGERRRLLLFNYRPF